MPCWTRVESKVEFLATSTDVGLLKAALEALGHRAVQETETGLWFGRGNTYDKSTGRLSVQENVDTAEIKRGYSEQVVNKAAQRNGWRVNWTLNATTGNRQATVLRKGE